MEKPGKKVWNLIEYIAHAVLSMLFSVVKIELTQERFEAIMQFVKFGIVGVSNSVASYVSYAVSLLIFQRYHLLPKSDYLVSQAIAFVLSVLWSYYWNNRLVFVVEEGRERSTWKTLIKTYISYSFTGLFLNSVLLVLWVKVFHISEFIAPIINLLIGMPINFLINKFWAFRTEDK